MVNLNEKINDGVKDLKFILEKHEREAIIFYTKIESNLTQIQAELRELQQGRASDSKDIEQLKKDSQRHETRLNVIYGCLVICGFLILVLFGN